MASKWFQDNSTTKTTNSNAGQIHFAASHEIDKSSIMLGNNQSNNLKDNSSEPTSTKSSPGLKPKWSDHELNHIDLADTLKYNLDNNEFPIESEIKSNISELMLIDEIKNKCDSPKDKGDSESTEAKKFQFFNKTSRSSSRSLIPESTDTAPLPSEIRQNLINNFKYPLCYADNDNSSLRFSLMTSFQIALFSIIFLSTAVIFARPFWFALSFIMGIIFCLFILYYFGLLNLKSKRKIISIPVLKDIKSPMIPNIMENDMENFTIHSTDDSKFSGWANIIGYYEIDSYNINQCYTLHIDVEDRKLRIRRPRKKIPRRAVWNEGQHSSTLFIGEAVFDLLNVQIKLLPEALVHKRLWSKKYPIQIILPKPICDYHIESSFLDIFNPKSKSIFLFGRTSRDKEEWFRRLLYSSLLENVELKMWNIILQHLTYKSSSTNTYPNILTSSASDSALPKSTSVGTFAASPLDDETGSSGMHRKITYNKTDEENEEELYIETKYENKIPQVAEYVKYMAKFMPADMFLLASEVMRLDINYISCADEMLGINALFGRLFWDFLRGQHWAQFIRNKIQCKLKKIHLPQFIDQLKVVDIYLGKELPLIRKLTRPYLNSRGLWVDAEITYSGGCSMILETKVNLFNLRNQARKSQDPGEDANRDLSKSSIDNSIGSDKTKSCATKTAAYLSSEEDSAESSTNSEKSDEESSAIRSSNSNQAGSPSSVANSNAANTGSKRILRWVDKIAKNPYFIKAADNKYVQRGMEYVSNTKLMLQVEMHSVNGTLALNIPPPPSDRLWYGFRPRPHVEISAKPKVGQKEISFTRVTDFIEKKLLSEFERVLVLPNMDDIPMPLLINGSVENYVKNL